VKQAISEKIQRGVWRPTTIPSEAELVGSLVSAA
jgi:DNA-binding GntR family transcriptional regulator